MMQCLPSLVRYEADKFEAQLEDLRARLLGVIEAMRPERLRDLVAHHREFWCNMHKCVQWANSNGGRHPLRIEELNAEVATLVEQWHSLNRVRFVRCCDVHRRRSAALACCLPSITHPALFHRSHKRTDPATFGLLAGMRRALWDGRSAPHDASAAVRILSNASDENPAGLPADIRASVEFAAPTFFDANGRASGRDAGLAAANHALRVRLLQSVVPDGVRVVLDDSAARLTLSISGAYSLVLALDTDAQAIGAPLSVVGEKALAVRAVSRGRWAWRVAGAVVEGDSGPDRVRPHDVQHVIARCEADEARGRAAAAVEANAAEGGAEGTAEGVGVEGESSGRRGAAVGVAFERAPLAHACAMLHSRALRIRLLAYKRAALELEAAYGLVVDTPRHADARAHSRAEEGAAPELRALESLSISFWCGERAVVIRLVAEAGTSAKDGSEATPDATAATRSFLEWTCAKAGAAPRPGQGTRIDASKAPSLRTLLDDALRALSCERIAALEGALERTLRVTSLPMDVLPTAEEEGAASRGAESDGGAEWWTRAHERFSRGALSHSDA